MRYTWVLFFTGCWIFLEGCLGGTFDKQPGQDEAMAIVWNQLYGEDGDPPSVEWFPGSGYLPGDSGATGMTLPGWKIQVGLAHTICPPGIYSFDAFDCSISGSELAHELMHYHTYLRTGDVDVGHWRGDWNLANNVAFQALIDARL